MNEENKIGYYAVIPATILFDKELKPNEKLLYAVITALSNKEGYCYASNTYLGDLFNVIPHTISIWVSHLKNKGFLYVDIITDTRGEIIQRRMYPNDTPYVLNKTYPYVSNKTEGMSQKRQYNNININKIDRLFNYILNNKQEFPEEFSKVDFSKIYTLLDKYEMLYTNKKWARRIKDNDLYKIVIFKITGYSFEKIKSELYLGERTVINMYNNFIIKISLLAVKDGLINI